MPLSEMATLEYTDAAQTIMKMDGKYTVTVSATCLSDDKADIQDAMDEFLNTLDLPDSVSEAETMMDKMQDDMFGVWEKPLQRHYSWYSLLWPCSLSLQSSL